MKSDEERYNEAVKALSVYIEHRNLTPWQPDEFRLSRRCVYLRNGGYYCKYDSQLGCVIEYSTPENPALLRDYVKRFGDDKYISREVEKKMKGKTQVEWGPAHRHGN